MDDADGHTARWWVALRRTPMAVWNDDVTDWAAALTYYMNSGRPDDCEVQAFHTATVSGPFDEQPADTCIRSKALWCNNIYRAPGLAPAPRIPRPEP